MNENGNPKRIDILVINDEAEVPSLLNPMTGKIFVTNSVGKHIVQLADGTLSFEAIVDEVAAHFKGAPVELIREEARLFLEQGRAAGLIEWAA
ncbi:MAG TPA: PqqD family protein [Thermoanaerobaculia bacterium]|nr:PqqD family protein [Thermoanaerobaculia bacterium]